MYLIIPGQCVWVVPTKIGPSLPTEVSCFCCVCLMVSEAFVVCLCAGIRVAGLWLGPTDAITIQITTSVIKETLEERILLNSFCLRVDRQMRRRALDKLCLPCRIFFSWPEDSGNRTAWKKPVR